MGIDRRTEKIVTKEFVIRIRFNKNYSWQGEFICLDTSEKLHFCSALELILQIQAAIDDSGMTKEAPKGKKVDYNNSVVKL
ncbi:MAG: hypothetical protein D5S00_02095 [Tindallia sp. MSAO_Bac2]|nr:MAG: hypothetical protein D5S00_02095 [Tindallia sp. MSAO_Bac2]